MLYQLTKPQLGTCDNVSGIVRCINRTARVYPANHNSSVPEFTLIPTHTKDMRALGLRHCTAPGVGET